MPDTIYITISRKQMKQLIAAAEIEGVSPEELLRQEFSAMFAEWLDADTKTRERELLYGTTRGTHHISGINPVGVIDNNGN